MDDLNFDNDEVLAFPTENLNFVMNKLRGLSEFFESCEVEYLVDKYSKYFPPQDGEYLISVDMISKFNDYLVADTLQELVSKGLVETLWDEEKQDFVFTLK